MSGTITITRAGSGHSEITHSILSEEGRGDAFFVDASNVLIRRPLGDPFHVYRSHDASGSFRVTLEVDGAVLNNTFNFHNGMVTSISDHHLSPLDGYRFPPTWVQTQRVGADGTPLPQAVVLLIDLISAVHAGTPAAIADDSDRAMVALALCSPEWLGPISPTEAWSLLDDAQLLAVTRWAR